MRKYIILTTLFVILPSTQNLLAGSATVDVLDESALTVFSSVRVFDGERVIPTATVVVQGTEITRVITESVDFEIPNGAIVIDGSGKTLLPGLIDAHSHTFNRAMLERALDFGVTTTLDMWTGVSFVQEIKTEDNNGTVRDRADMLSSSIGVTAPESHGTQFGPVPTLSKPEDAAGFVADRVADGADYIKIIYDNFKMINRPVPTLDKQTLIAVIDAAHQQDKLAVVHSRDVDAYADVVEAGADGIVHAPVDAVPNNSLIRALANLGIFVIPTLSISTPSGPSLADDPMLGPDLTEKELGNLRGYSPMHGEGGDQVSIDSVTALHQGGVTILAGSDSPNRGTAAGASIHQELELLVQAGLTATQALITATSAPADAFDLSDRGRIAKGRLADLLLVEGQPDQQITDSRNIIGVWKAGKHHRSE